MRVERDFFGQASQQKMSPSEATRRHVGGRVNLERCVRDVSICIRYNQHYCEVTSVVGGGSKNMRK